MLPPPEKCGSQCGHPLGIAMRPTLQVLMGSAHTTSLLAIIDPLFTLSWALKASQVTVVGAATALCTRLVARGGIYHPVLSPAVSSPSNRLKLGGCGPR